MYKYVYMYIFHVMYLNFNQFLYLNHMHICIYQVFNDSYETISYLVFIDLHYKYLFYNNLRYLF